MPILDPKFDAEEPNARQLEVESNQLLEPTASGGWQDLQSRLHGLCGTVKDFYFPSEADYVLRLLKKPALKRALMFVPALLITLVIEVTNGTIISANADWLQQHFILVVFIPVMSAIAGNIGLQTSSSVTAYLNLRRQSEKGHIPVVGQEWLPPMEIGWTYLRHNIINIIFMAFMAAGIVLFWQIGDECDVPYAVIVFCGSFVNCLIAAVMGVVTPLVSDRVHFDPSAIAGPFETAVQDIVGGVSFIYIAKLVLKHMPPNDCKLGSCATICDDDFDYPCMQACNGSVPCYVANC